MAVAPVSQPMMVSRPLMQATGELDRAKKSAREFEAMTLGQMLAPMFDTVKNSRSLFSGGAGEEAWKPMLVTEIAKKIAAGGGLGLAKPILAEMLRMQEARAASDVPTHRGKK